jgi:hypothetical protein
MERKIDILDQANVVANSYIDKEFTRAVVRVEKLKKGDPEICNCPNCIKEAVHDANANLRMVSRDEKVYEAYHYEVKPTEKGLEITQGQQYPRSVWDPDSNTGLKET